LPTTYDILPIAAEKLEKPDFRLHCAVGSPVFGLDKAGALWQYIVEVFRI